jgi:nitrite reductase (NADH) large subunit
LTPPAPAILKHKIAALGIKVHLKKLTTAVLGDDDVQGLAFEDGETLDCDMVMIAAGIILMLRSARAGA